MIKHDLLDRIRLARIICDPVDPVCAKMCIRDSSNGIDTYVGKGIDIKGFEPSGGEGQKIAIARALYHTAPIYLLDEPTAALDPFAEYEIYEQFNSMIAAHTAILITHRMSAVGLANKVAVFDKGHVAEYGTHAELYAKGGIYTETVSYTHLPSKTEKISNTTFCV